MSQPVIERQLEHTPVYAGRWMVVIFNNDVNSMEEVIAVIMLATSCNVEEARIEAWEAHTYGQASIHFSDRTTCEEAATVIRGIGVQTEVRKEWEE